MVFRKYFTTYYFQKTCYYLTLKSLKVVAIIKEEHITLMRIIMVVVITVVIIRT